MSADSIQQPHGGVPDPPRRRPATLYYRQHGVIVTGRYLTVDADRYDLAELGELMQARGSLHPGAIAGGVIAVAAAVLLAPLVSALRAPVAWLLALVALLIPCLVGLVCARRWPAQYELVARYRGQQVTLFATRDEREFGQVARAVRRALEALRGD
jgi:Family of unknown function (DUF6232)